MLVSEPTRRGVNVYRQYAAHAAGHGVVLRVLGNKVATGTDLAAQVDAEFVPGPLVRS